MRSFAVIVTFLATLLTGCGTATTQSTQAEESTASTVTTGAQSQSTTALEQTAPATVTTPTSWAIAVGDSAMLGAIDTLKEVPNLALTDAQGSRQVPEAIDLLKQYHAAGHLGDVVVVHLGNNGPFTAQEFDEMMGVLSDVREVLVVNLTVPSNVEEDPVIVPNNAVIADEVQRYPEKAVLVDWYSANVGHPEYVWDGIHLTPEGASAYASLLASYLGSSEETTMSLGPKEEISWGALPKFGRCVGPPSWCNSVVRA